ncbi:hypothetical protein I302_103032 [Kwoniella bestiolae CBS 10118]|uniref:Tartrate transporter n=1 Tax=Kwoniella bestiolae CBS 10118 TaxID=1296100 RepID=A0A1B9GGM0_9TREE|nr:tartrate transporter [Kwoniella bestiolae CBS 10118]OCF30209.1 tartrate transporter [Kwoniella bestiolae CBS 10118]
MADNLETKQYDTKDAELAVLHESVDDANVGMPESLRALTEDERHALEKKIVRKADMVILPIIGVLYILNYIDRQNLSAAKLQGIMDDLNMTTQQFATSISILFVGYLPFQIPSNLIISHITRPGAYICTAVTIWGSISAATAAVQSYKALLAVRVILGAVEAVFFPGVIYLLSAWYKKNELGRRIAGLYIGQQVGNAFGGLIAAGCLKLDGAHGIRGWRWLFIIEGVATVGLGLIFALFLPEYPHNAKMLTPLERDMAVWRLEKEAGAAEGNEQIGTMEGFFIGLKDPKIYALIFMNMMSQCMGSIANFFPTIVKTLGYNSINTLLLTAPPYVFAGFFYCGLTWYSDRKNTMYTPILFCLCLASITYIISLATTNTAARYTAMIFMPSGSVGPQLLLYKTINHHMPRPVAKRAAAIAMMNAIGGTSNIWTSYLWYNGPRYFAAFGALLASGVVFATTITAYKFYLRRQNQKLEAGGDRARETMKHGVTQQMIDMGWRYEGY